MGQVSNHRDMLEYNVVEAAREWFIAKRAADENAGQPVNWADFNLGVLEEAAKELVEDDEFYETFV